MHKALSMAKELQKGKKKSFLDLFRREKKIIKALSSVSFEIEEGDIVGYIGPNGAGKSTLLNCSCGLLSPKLGTVLLNGKDIKSMLPHELALCCDDELHDLFLYKFATQNLQTFQHKSELLKPSRLVSPHPARIKGPMIVCVDRSGSMAGLPEELANSLMMKLLLIADRQKRDLFLISFSVNATPIDVRHDRTALLDFFKQSSIGDTNATQMLNMVFELLESGDYASADVLWFTDFIIPMCGIEQRRKITYYSRLGTKFYGLKIGKALDKRGWENYFHEIVEIEK